MSGSVKQRFDRVELTTQLFEGAVALRPDRISIGTLLAKLTFLAACAQSFGASTPVLGPEDFVQGSGTPVVQSRDFTVNISDTSSTYLLHIDNDGVSSAVVTVNGARVLGPIDFAPSVPQITKPLSLVANNHITIQMLGKPGERCTLQVIRQTHTAPTLTAVSPAAGNPGQKSLLVKVTGNGTHFQQGLTIVSSGAGVTVNNVTVANATTLTARLDIASNAVAGFRTITAHDNGNDRF